MSKQIYIIAGPNGAGKTSFATKFIPTIQNVTQFINADLIAYGLSPFNPELEAVQAGKLMLKQIDKWVKQGENFCLETTLAGRIYIKKILDWQKQNYCINLIFLQLADVQTALLRVENRVKQGGHNISKDIIIRRFEVGFKNFHLYYKNIVDYWLLYNNDTNEPILIGSGRKYE